MNDRGQIGTFALEGRMIETGGAILNEVQLLENSENVGWYFKSMVLSLASEGGMAIGLWTGANAKGKVGAGGNIEVRHLQIQN